MTFFDYLNNILFEKSEAKYNEHVNNIDFESTFSTYMLLRYCTMTRSEKINMFIATRHHILERLPPRAVYQFLLKTLPKQRFYRLTYVK